MTRRRRAARIGLILLLGGCIVAGVSVVPLWWEDRSVDYAARLLDLGQYAEA